MFFVAPDIEAEELPMKGLHLGGSPLLCHAPSPRSRAAMNAETLMCVGQDRSVLADLMNSGWMCEVGPARKLTFETVDVFTDERLAGGNPLAVVFGAEGESDETLQRIAREFNYAEITFVLPPEDARKTARVRIFTPTEEYPFAGHPNVGTACVLARRGVVFGKAVGDELVFEELAGDVRVSVARNGNGQVAGATLSAPEAFSMLPPALSASALAACLGLPVDAIDVSAHAPIVASVGLPFVFVQLTTLFALKTASPDLALWKRTLAATNGMVHCYVSTGDNSYRARMFCPLEEGGGEDAATGSANGALVGLLAETRPGFPADGTTTCVPPLLPSPRARRADAAPRPRRILVTQGVEMRRASSIYAHADREGGMTRRVRVGGDVVGPVFSGEINLA